VEALPQGRCELFRELTCKEQYPCLITILLP
jgi:hypothetical protein